MLKAIETVYRGYRFRSRLEARWAVCFDTLDIAYEYEPQGFDLGGVPYLPDFYLPDLRWWIEIKPERPTSTDLMKCGRFGAALHAEFDERWNAYTNGRTKKERASEPPEQADFAVLVGTPGEAMAVRFYGALPVNYELAECALCRRLIMTQVREGSSWETNGAHRDMYHCEWCDTRDRAGSGPNSDQAYFHKGDVVVGYDVRRSPRLEAAYARARAARFEHGEQP